MGLRAFLIVGAAFVLSVLVRVPHIGRPLSAHHEFCTALVLIFLENWRHGGFLEHRGCPAANFPGEADRFIYPRSYAFAARNGTFYYLSHPPLAYWLPHGVLTLTGVPPGPTALTLFNLVFHFTTALLLFLTVRELCSEPAALPRAPLIAALLYLFMPAPLWFHGNAYMADMFVQNTWALHLLVAARVFRRGITGGWPLALLSVSLALAVLTSWLGVFVGITTAVLAFIRWHRTRQPGWWRVMAATLLAIVLPLALTGWVYAGMVGLPDLLTYLHLRFHDRAAYDFVEGGPLTHVWRLAANYRTGWLPVMLLAAAGGATLAGWLRNGGRAVTPPRHFGLFAALTLLPVALDHAVLLKYADHDFAALKGGFFLCGAAAMLLAAAIGARPHLRPWAWCAVGLACVAGVLLFFRYNPLPGGDRVRYDRQLRIGTAIAREASAQEVVFALGFEPDPQTMWYARRNIAPVATLEQARAFLVERGRERGVVFSGPPDSLVQQRIVVGAGSNRNAQRGE
jgi:hypothetical protein